VETDRTKASAAAPPRQSESAQPLEVKPAPHKLGAIVAPRADLDDVCILLDIDGTLLDIAPSPQEVRVPASLHSSLAHLSERTDGAVAFVSGRPLSDIDRLFAPLRLAAVGGHGAEVRPSGSHNGYHKKSKPLDPKLKKRFAEIAKLGPGILVEDKDFSIALHYRLAPQLGGDVVRTVAAICERWACDNVEILPGKSVIEIKARGYDKGSGVCELMTYPPFKGRQPIFIGDDTTDNAAFEVLPHFHGIGFSVGGIVPGASFNFDGPKDVRRWLEQISASDKADAS
jgi:trehalose 6-phosphate phosphatase